MTEKHFKALAEELLNSKPPKYESLAEGWSQAYYQWRYDVEAIIDVCKQFNGKFDEEKFKRACGMEE